MNIRLKYSYRKFPDEPSEAFPRRHSALRPVIPITLINGNQRITYLALIDSGADLCIAHAEIGEQIGIEVESGKSFTFYGISKKPEPLKAYRHDIKIEVGGYQFDCTFGFTRDIPNMPYGILGQIDFFKIFDVFFDYNKERMELMKRSNG